MDRFFSTTLFLLALGCLAGAVLLLLGAFLEYLQVGRWQFDSLLDAAYDLRLLEAGWFLRSDLAYSLRGVLQQVPVVAAMFAVAPVAWWLSRRLSAR